MNTLEEIMSGGEISQTVLIMADTVANIEHAANEGGKGAMAAIQASAQASEAAKVLAEVIENLSHTASADAKKMLAQAFP
jgi:predicted PilT family ATPase